MGFREISGFGHIDLTDTDVDRSVLSTMQEEQAGTVIVFRGPESTEVELRLFDPDHVRQGLNPTPTTEAS
jgi:hypothetical protein